MVLPDPGISTWGWPQNSLVTVDAEVGTYRLNGRGYIECVFPDLSLTGLPCELAPERLAFHAFRAGPGVTFSLVYTRKRPGRRTRHCTFPDNLMPR